MNICVVGTGYVGLVTGAVTGKLPLRVGRRRRSWSGWFVWRGGLLLAILAVLAWFAPKIIATTGLWKPLVGKFAPPLAGRVDAASLSLGWLSPIVVKDLVVRDEAGEVLAQVGVFQSEKTLLSLARIKATWGSSPLMSRKDGSCSVPTAAISKT